MISKDYTLGIDIGSTTVKIALLDNANNIVFSDYKRHFANIQETLADLLAEAQAQCGNITLHPVITGSGGLTLASHLDVPFVQEVIAVSTALKALAPKTDVAIELGGEDAKILSQLLVTLLRNMWVGSPEVQRETDSKNVPSLWTSHVIWSWS